MGLLPDAALMRRGAPGYEELRGDLVASAFLPERYPEIIIRARSVDDVVAAVRLSRSLGLHIVTRSGGHSWCAAALRDGGLLLDVSKLDDLRIDPEERRLTIGPGLATGALTSALAGHRLAFPAGHCREVGLGGYLLAGGLGWNAGTWGPACHSVEAVEVVTAAGDVVIADESHHADLLWAARGAGPGFFGVVTAFTARAYEAPRCTVTSSLAFPLAALADVAAWVEQLSRGLDRRLELSLAFAHAPAAIGALGIRGGDPVVVMTAAAFADSREECDGLLAPFDEGVGRRGFVEDKARRETPQHALFELTGARFPVGRRIAADCLWSESEPSLLLGALGSALSVAPNASAWILVNIGSEQPPLVAPTPAAFSMAGRFYVAVYAVWDESEAAARNQAWLGETMRALEPLASGRYIGEVDLTARPERARTSFSPAAWQRLNAVRDHYDGEHLVGWFPGLG